MANEAQRVLLMLKKLNSGNTISYEEEKYNNGMEKENSSEIISERTFQRGIERINEIFPEAIEKIPSKKSSYRALKKDILNNFLNKEGMSLLVQIFNIAQVNNIDLSKNFDISKDDEELLKRRIKNTSKCYDFRNKPFEENKQNMDCLSTLERAITYRKYLEIKYANSAKVYKINPYKILFLNENFYLASVIKEQHFEFSLFRISKIKDIKELSDTFQKRPEIENFISNIQTPFATFENGCDEKDLTEIKLEVCKRQAYHFKAKKFLKSQEIQELENGNIIVSYRLTQSLEIEELIKKWIPFVRILSPKSFKEKFAKDIEDLLSEKHFEKIQKNEQ